MLRPPSMALIGLIAVGLLGCVFVLYVLFQWRHEKAKKDRISAEMVMRLNRRTKKIATISEAAHQRPSRAVD